MIDLNTVECCNNLKYTKKIKRFTRELKMLYCIYAK